MVTLLCYSPANQAYIFFCAPAKESQPSTWFRVPGLGLYETRIDGVTAYAREYKAPNAVLAGLGPNWVVDPQWKA